jgi:LysM repeat protein
MMEKLITISLTGNRSNIHFFRWIHLTLIFGVATFSALCAWPTPAGAAESYRTPFVGQPGHLLGDIEAYRTMIGGHSSVWRPASSPMGPYRSDLLKPHAVGLAKPLVNALLQPFSENDLHCDIVLTRHCTESSLLWIGDTHAPPDIVKREESGHHGNTWVATLSLREEVQVYLVRQGDSLWNIAKRFSMKRRTLAEMNELRPGEILQVNRPLKVNVSSSQEFTLNLTSRSIDKDPSLLNHIRLTDGRPVPHWMVKNFAAEVPGKSSAAFEDWIDGDNRKPLTVVVNFQLVKSHLEVRAREFRSIVMTHAEKYRLDPALIMAMIHTESAFNPRASSRASAYGLMQLVPHTAGKEAYRRVYGQPRELTPEYLYDPDNNIELGAAYFTLLRDRYLASIDDPTSRTYCAVAAYHAGPSSVGRAFTSKPSIRQAAQVINALKPGDVYKRLVEALPAVTSRNYVRKVITRAGKYRGWYSETNAAQAPPNSGKVSL